MEIRIDIDDGDVQAALDRVEHALGDWRPVWPEITSDFHDIERRRFASQGEGSWDPWGPLYVQWVNFSSSRILHDSGGLEASLTEGPPLSEGDLELDLGTRYRAMSNAGQSVPVAEILDAGFTAKGRMKLSSGRSVDVTGVGVPGRKLIDVKESDVERWAMHVNDWIAREIAEAGL